MSQYHIFVHLFLPVYKLCSYCIALWKNIILCLKTRLPLLSGLSLCCFPVCVNHLFKEGAFFLVWRMLVLSQAGVNNPIRDCVCVPPQPLFQTEATFCFFYTGPRYEALLPRKIKWISIWKGQFDTHVYIHFYFHSYMCCLSTLFSFL